MHGRLTDIFYHPDIVTLKKNYSCLEYLKKKDNSMYVSKWVWTSVETDQVFNITTNTYISKSKVHSYLEHILVWNARVYKNKKKNKGLSHPFKVQFDNII